VRAGETMKKKEQKIVRFYSDNPEHRKAFDILQNINAEKHSSIQDFIISAINLLGDMELNEECPTVDRKDWEEPLIERIAGAVETIIDEKLPQIIASYLIGIQTGQTTNPLCHKAFLAEKRKIEVLMADLRATLENAEINKINIETENDKLLEDINRLVNDMNESLRPVIDSKLEEISGLLEKRELWNVMHANDSKIKKYEDRISELESSKEKVTNKSKSNVKDISEEKLAQFSEIVKKMLVSWNFIEEKSNVVFDEQNKDLCVDGKRKELFGKGAIEIVSFPGPDRSVTIEGLKSYRVSNRRYRNRRIGDFLKELHLTEGRNTGFKKILDALEANGSPKPEFETDEDRSYFITRLFIHEAFAKDVNERKLSEVNEKNERSLSEVLSGVLKASDFSKLEKLIKYIEEKGKITPKEAEVVSGKSAATVRRYLKMLVGTGYVEAVGNTNNSVYKISEYIKENY